MKILIAVPLSADHGRPMVETCRGITETLTGGLPVTEVRWGPDNLGGAGAVHLQRNWVADYVRKVKTVTHVLMVDSDIGFTQADVLALIKAHVHLVTGFYVSKDARGAAPVTYFDRGDGELVPLMARGLQKIDAAGLGFCLIAREVFEALDPPWFVPGAEDLEFFKRARAAGIQPWCQYDADLVHLGGPTRYTRAHAEATARGLGLIYTGQPYQGALTVM